MLIVLPYDQKLTNVQMSLLSHNNLKDNIQTLFIFRLDPLSFISWWYYSLFILKLSHLILIWILLFNVRNLLFFLRIYRFGLFYNEFLICCWFFLLILIRSLLLERIGKLTITLIKLFYSLSFRLWFPKILIIRVIFMFRF
jgi:hypothetical protein